MNAATTSPWPRRTAMCAAILTFPLLLLGGTVTTLRVGMSVPDWPTTFGHNMFTYPLRDMLANGAVFWEHTHRLFGSLVGLAAIASVVAHFRFELRKSVRWLSYAALLAVIGQGVLGGLRGESLVWTDLDVWRRRLMASPWVQDAALRRSLPSTVEVVVSERRPIGIGRLGGEMYLVDERGVIIDRYGPQYADFDLPIVDGLSAAPAETGSMTDESRAELAARVIAAVAAKPEIARRLSQVDVTDLHNATVILNGDHAVLQLGEDHFLARLQSYLDLAAALRERVADIDSVDLRFDERIYVRPNKLQRKKDGR